MIYNETIDINDKFIQSMTNSDIFSNSFLNKLTSSINDLIISLSIITCICICCFTLTCYTCFGAKYWFSLCFGFNEQALKEEERRKKQIALENASKGGWPGLGGYQLRDFTDMPSSERSISDKTSSDRTDSNKTQKKGLLNRLFGIGNKKKNKKNRENIEIIEISEKRHRCCRGRKPEYKFLNKNESFEIIKQDELSKKLREIRKIEKRKKREKRKLEREARIVKKESFKSKNSAWLKWLWGKSLKLQSIRSEIEKSKTNGSLSNSKIEFVSEPSERSKSQNSTRILKPYELNFLREKSKSISTSLSNLSNKSNSATQNSKFETSENLRYKNRKNERNSISKSISRHRIAKK